MKGKAILALAVVLSMSACVSPNWRSNLPTVHMPGTGSSQQPGDGAPGGQAGLAMSSDQRFPDVPLPIGLTADAERTYVYDSGNLKVGRLVYKTRADKSEIGEFYLREAPAAGWKFERMVESETLELYFSKDGKQLTVAIGPLGMGRGQQLVINYNPAGGSNS